MSPTQVEQRPDAAVRANKKRGREATAVSKKPVSEEAVAAPEKEIKPSKRSKPVPTKQSDKAVVSQLSSNPETGKASEGAQEEAHTGKQRRILFVGNLPYNAKIEEIERHFRTAGGITSVRLLTDKITKKPKGFAFMEFDNTDSFQKALMFHHTMFKGRQINVELTAGGGGKGDNRKQKLKEKNEGLEAMRTKIFDKKIQPAKQKSKLEKFAANVLKTVPNGELSGPNSIEVPTKRVQ